MGGIGEELKHCFGGGAAGDGDTGLAARLDGFDGGIREELGGSAGYGDGIGEDAVGESYWAGHEVSIQSLRVRPEYRSPMQRILHASGFLLRVSL